MKLRYYLNGARILLYRYYPLIDLYSMLLPLLLLQ